MTTQEKIKELNESISQQLKKCKSAQRSCDNNDLSKALTSIIELTEWIAQLLEENEQLKANQLKPKQNYYQRIVYKDRR
jgi:uncharacterized small protein (DUF1192 family)